MKPQVVMDKKVRNLRQADVVLKVLCWQPSETVYSFDRDSQEFRDLQTLGGGSVLDAKGRVCPVQSKIFHWHRSEFLIEDVWSDWRPRVRLRILEMSGSTERVSCHRGKWM